MGISSDRVLQKISEKTAYRNLILADHHSRVECRQVVMGKELTAGRLSAIGTFSSGIGYKEDTCFTNVTKEEMESLARSVLGFIFQCK